MKKVKFAVLIWRTIFLTSEKHHSRLWLARNRFCVTIYNTPFPWVYFSMYIIKCYKSIHISAPKELCLATALIYNQTNADEYYQHLTGTVWCLVLFCPCVPLDKKSTLFDRCCTSSVISNNRNTYTHLEFSHLIIPPCVATNTSSIRLLQATENYIVKVNTWNFIHLNCGEKRDENSFTRSSSIWNFIYSKHDSLPAGFIAQLVRALHRYPTIMGSNPFKPESFHSFKLSLLNIHNCDELPCVRKLYCIVLLQKINIPSHEKFIGLNPTPLTPLEKYWN